MRDFTTKMRKELEGDYNVFFVTAWGYAADHLFGWVPKALNTHRDVFALLAHEGSRPKYFNERTRGERPPLIPYTEFLNDMGMTYSAIGDCYSYRAGQMPELLGVEQYKNVPVVNLVRHPVAWLEFYARWRTSNMRMRAGVTDPLAWEWKNVNHAYLGSLGLRSYSKDDIEIWATYQGMLQLNNVLGDINAIQYHIPIEIVADEPDVFKDLANYLCRNQIVFDQADIDRAYVTRHTLFRGEEEVICDPVQLMASWPGWKVDAFRKLVSRDAMSIYTSFGYDLKLFLERPFSMPAVTGGLNQVMFVSSVPKSGTWLLRDILEMATDLKSYEPEMCPGPPDYGNENLIEFPPGTFFSWHSTLNSRSVSLLRSVNSKNVFLIRNIYDVLLSMLNHLSHDVDASIGRSVIGGDYFVGKTIEQRLTLMIAGFTSPRLTWMGVGPIIKQIDSMLELVESGGALLLSYERLVADKSMTIQSICQYLGVSMPDKRLREIVLATDEDVTRMRRKADGSDAHITPSQHKAHRDLFQPFQREMVDLAIMVNAPQLPSRLGALGFGYICAYSVSAP